MKLTTLKSLTAACVMFASVAASAGVKFTIDIPSIGDNTLLAQTSQPRFYPTDRYIDLEAACTTIISDLDSALSEAGLYVRSDMEASANTIYLALKEANRKLGGGFYGGANPNTVIALNQASILSDVIMNEVEHFRPVIKDNTTPLKLSLIYNLAKLVIQAHKLDTRFFYNSINQCSHSSCYMDPARNLEFLDSEYFGETAGLAKMFISMYSSDSRRMSHNLLEMILVAQLSRSAAEVLSTSFYRRDYACAVTRLARLNGWVQKQVQSYLSKPEGEDREKFLNDIIGWGRAQMYWAQEEINLQQCN